MGDNQLEYFVICSGKTVPELQVNFERKVLRYYGESKNFRIVPYGNVQFLNNEYIMTFVIERR